MKKTTSLIYHLLRQPGIKAYEHSGVPYTRQYDVEITERYAKENRHPKMPEKYVAIIVPIGKDGMPL
ncbi:hypothetical protein WS105_0659 [Weissella ceti]|uniref:hypothetical protein n=1 Tax=Weissella ceti TaxID=759620 RepID=UPI0004F7C45F|nr:hypothetical protein [Weissella ceti]AIM64249.1 hypothetical protein WS105_0659 [Weissella ceti]